MQTTADFIAQLKGALGPLWPLPIICNLPGAMLVIWIYERVQRVMRRD